MMAALTVRAFLDCNKSFMCCLCRPLEAFKSDLCTHKRKYAYPIFCGLVRVSFYKSRWQSNVCVRECSRRIMFCAASTQIICFWESSRGDGNVVNKFVKRYPLIKHS